MFWVPQCSVRELGPTLCDILLFSTYFATFCNLKIKVYNLIFWTGLNLLNLIEEPNSRSSSTSSYRPGTYAIFSNLFATFCNLINSPKTIFQSDGDKTCITNDYQQPPMFIHGPPCGSVHTHWTRSYTCSYRYEFCVGC